MSTEMKKLIIGGTEYEIVDDAGRTRITALEQGAVIGGGLSQIEKDYLLELFGKAAYAENDASEAFNALSALWADSTVYHAIAWTGTGYTKGNAAARVEDGTSYTSTITANTGFNITAVTVTMGGTEVQGAWSNGTVTIPNVTGDIVITVTTAQITVSSISAVYTQSGTVYDTDSLDSLKSDLVVTATFMDSSTGVIDAADYTLSGTLAEGTSTVTVSYAGLTDTFSVTVSQGPLYPFVTGTKTFLTSSDGTATNRVVTVKNGNVVRGELIQGYQKDLHVNISNVTLNTDACNDGANYQTSTEKLFTIPSGASVSYSVTPLTVDYKDSTIGAKQMNITVRNKVNDTAPELFSLLPSTRYDALVVGTPITGSFTAESDMDVWCIGMWMASSASRYATVELEVELAVNGTRYI